MIKNKFSFVIYLLSAVLVLALSTFIFMVITHISYINVDKITISKYTGERVFNKPYIKGINLYWTY
ncbi:hypothetical protein K9O30_04220 [Clostridium bowmanii]|uniref:hypothetical protein n=1 Tax=Clostridium bowmanii TaxID=132925 RepID=UPI001C0BDE82|nr:hypothetical protein [Clostridium bowmanii]MBU3188565.1 hypothetical protein [Clostridium bowmanii]MCA1072949.1 hypothetical protein [Clostridium bowmanii]